MTTTKPLAQSQEANAGMSDAAGTPITVGDTVLLRVSQPVEPEPITKGTRGTVTQLAPAIGAVWVLFVGQVSDVAVPPDAIEVVP